MDKGGSRIACGSGLPGLAAVWPSLRLHRPPTPDDVVVVPVASSQCRSHRPVVLPVTIPVAVVIRGCPPSDRGLAAVSSSLDTCVATLVACTSLPVRN